jgi:coatomer subunit gamma
MDLVRLPCSMREPLHKLFEGWLRHKSDMVNFEAARAICAMENVTEKEVSPALQLLQLFLTSPRFIGRFTAIRILQNFASTHPHLVNPLNPDIEALISDSNRSITTYAITTLLKTGNEASVDRLMKEITGFIESITDEFKITIVEAIRSLSLKFTNKQGVMLEFLAGMLRDENGFEFKKAVVEAIFDMIKYIPASREDGTPTDL